ncbi:hypothetical protein [Paraburkholderia acidisoli]|uniref:Tfp pilus assembly protein PilO n=1 Tax=Paraburkholderia acidisoli TaxID=2571748 RepID=A0A7Z2GIN8_9BURK|nr:hypothetical protein [Paraburkholderia acidisoli]QGZ62521.1 hypothetical protein FAZ98_12725 [Paraburkholderia acidisoli]
MNTLASAGNASSPSPLLAERGARLSDWLAVHAWPRRRRARVAVAIGVIAAIASSTACLVADPLDVHAARRALADAHQHRTDAQRVLARLPALRREAAQFAPRAPHAGHAADDIRRVSQLAAESGLVLQTLEPLASSALSAASAPSAPSTRIEPGAAKAEPYRAMKLGAQGGFAPMRRFVEALAREPALTVPFELALRRTGETLSVAATVRVYDGLAPLPATAARPLAADPFARSLAAVAGSAPWRLVGVLQDRRRSVALVETPEGVVAVQAGVSIAGGRVASIDASRVVIETGGARQTLTWAEAAK